MMTIYIKSKFIIVKRISLFVCMCIFFFSLLYIVSIGIYMLFVSISYNKQHNKVPNKCKFCFPCLGKQFSLPPPHCEYKREEQKRSARRTYIHIVFVNFLFMPLNI